MVALHLHSVTLPLVADLSPCYFLHHLLQRDDCCTDDVAAACSRLTDEGQVLTATRQLSRCLAFRQLLGEALAQALSSICPFIPATVEGVASNAAVETLGYGCSATGFSAAAAPGLGSGQPGSVLEGVLGAAAGLCHDTTVANGGSEVLAGRHVCDLFMLPRPGLQGVGSPVVADPIVFNTLVGEQLQTVTGRGNPVK